nr:reverse transcriptase domain-containing protein [Tanacetum cinerariifolium]
MAPKRAIRSTTVAPAATTKTTPTTTISVTNSQLKAMIDQGVTEAMAACDADRNMNGEGNHNSGTGVRRTKRVTHEIQKLEAEMWELKVKGADLASYTQCFQELALLCGRMFPEESDKIEKYVNGIPDMIYGSVMASKPQTM